MYNRTNIFLTGASGKIGKHFLNKIDFNKYNVYTLGRSPIDNPNVTHLTCSDYSDTEQISSILSALSEIDTFIHLGANVSMSMDNFYSYYDNELKNLFTILNVLNTKNIRKIIYASSYMIYGYPLYSPIDEKHPQQPDTLYGVLKLAIEKTLHIFCEKNNIPFISLRISGVYGFGDPALRNLIPQLILKLRNQQDISLSFKGKLFRDYVHVDDVVDSISLALEYEKSDIFNIGSGNAYSSKQIYETAQSYFENISPITLTQSSVIKKDLIIDINKARQKLNYSPKFSIAKGLKDELQKQLKKTI